MRPLLVAAAGVLAGCALLAQTAGEPAVLDLIVELPRPGAALRSDEVEIREAGAVLPIEQLRLVEPSLDRSPLPPIATEADERAAAQDADRIVAVYVDEYHLTENEAFVSARRAVAGLLRTSLGPRDLVVVLKPLDSIVAIRLGTDRERAAGLVDGAQARRGEYTARTTFEQEFLAGAPSRIETTRAQIVRSGLSALAAHLGRFRGRKTLILLSDTLPDVPMPARSGQGAAGIDPLIRTANRARVAVYPVRPSADAAQPKPDGPVSEPAVDGLETLAAQTTGTVVAGGSGLAAGLSRLLAEASRYYELSVALPAGPPDQRFRPVDVRVRRPGVVVRARAGFATTDTEPVDRMAALRTRPEMLRVPRRTSPLIRTWFGQSRDAEGRTRVDFVWEPGVRRAGERASQPIPSRVSLSVTTLDGTPIFSGESTPSGEAVLGAAGRTLLTFSAAPGQLLVQMDILDLAGRVLDHDARDLVVGGFPGPVSFGTAAVFRVRTRRDLRALEENQAAPVAARAFSRAEQLIVRIPVITGEAATVSARLVSGFGAPLRSLDVRAVAGDPQLQQVTVPLASLASAGYAVEFTARVAGTSAVGRLDFTVTP